MSTFAAPETLNPSRIDFDREVEDRRQDPDADLTGWFCIRTRPFPCPAQGCDFVAVFQTAAHLIVVWPAQDDPTLLAAAHNLALVDRDPHIVEYQPKYGPCIAWDEWNRLGRPLHGQLERPAGWLERSRKRL